MADALNGRDWWYARLYPGGLNRLDLAATSVLPALADEALANGADRWFFLQYTDWKGPHLRVRVQGPRAPLDALHRQRGRISSQLRGIQRTKVPERGSLVPLELRPFSGTHTGFEVGVYEPENSKYGGQDGVETAEAVFQESSVLALWGLGFPRHPDRAALALLLLEAAVAALAPWGTGAEVFWQRHLAWWTQDAGSRAGVLRDRLRDLAAEDPHGVGESAARLAADPVVRARTRGWTETLTLCLTRAHEQQNPYSAGHLVFHHAHMMCNRLGILPREEALLGAMAARTEATTRKPSPGAVQQGGNAEPCPAQ
ncbi:lantibiotic dehydratase C-terminal domain-containing protein [Streptomyces iconiensis]|uniref:Lantibiotic dehydratase C-terminal domain-containing protein n=1 Tax=Streptomyces iconiensis TaxID=1384038 RepID=A0ABT6ZUQ6_9ACTN|nr:lantibiotic dehydratase C-terminal domain-containing protein [Streptomyces iconiensis]MDJ1132799.1 lantibiotic dehydratase C-terminal domain-containing protein [Streptomyces iconiensis]